MARGRGAITCLVWDLCDKKTLQLLLLLIKEIFVCQIIATNIFGENVAGLVKPVLKSVSNIMNKKRWRNLPLLWFVWHYVTVTTFLLKTIAAECKSIKTVSKGRYIGYLLDCGPFYNSVIVILQKIVVTTKYVTISWYL